MTQLIKYKNRRGTWTVEPYQDAFIGDKQVIKGVRDCESRLKMIAPLVKGNTILDIGSSFGYFVKNLLKGNPERIGVSVERNHGNIEVQIDALTGLSNVILIEGELGPEYFEELSQTPEIYDNVLMLAVLHHFSLPRRKRLCEAIDLITPRVFLELQHEEENPECNIKNVAPLFPNKKFTKLGEVPSHLTKFPREIYIAEGFVRREVTKNYMRSGERPKSYKKNGDVFIKEGKESKWIPGLTLWNLQFMGKIYFPTLPAMLHSIHHAFDKKDGCDFRPWNMLFVPETVDAENSLIFFDTDDHPELPKKQDDLYNIMAWISKVCA